MDVVIITNGTPKEIADLVLVLQGQQGLVDVSEQDIKALAQATYDRRRELQAQPDS